MRQQLQLVDLQIEMVDVSLECNDQRRDYTKEEDRGWMQHENTRCGLDGVDRMHRQPLRHSLEVLITFQIQSA